MRLVVATRNEHKLRELGEILSGFDLVPLPPEVDLPPEEGETFAANAMIKARAARAAGGGAARATGGSFSVSRPRARPGEGWSAPASDRERGTVSDA